MMASGMEGAPPASNSSLLLFPGWQGNGGKKITRESLARCGLSRQLILADITNGVKFHTESSAGAGAPVAPPFGQCCHIGLGAPRTLPAGRWTAETEMPETRNESYGMK